MISLEERCLNYQKVFPKYPSPDVGSDGRMTGTWMIGQNYQNVAGYYGEYPRSYLKRIMALFPDKTNKEDILHLFSGSIQSSEGVTFDVNSQLNPDIYGDAHQLSRYFPNKTFSLILADPPYSSEDAKKYGTPMITRNKVVKECAKLLPPQGFLCWLDQVFPMYRKDQFDLVGLITIIRSTNHRVRVVFIFQKRHQTGVK